jgi:hypothetical protein
VVERFASLLSQAASAPPSSTETDESRVCGGPGKVLDAGLLQQMLAQVPPQHQLFYGPSKSFKLRTECCIIIQNSVLYICSSIYFYWGTHIIN